MVSAVAWSIEATSFPCVTTISGSRPVAPAAVASSVPGRAGIPAANTSAPNASAATSVAPAATGRGHRLGYPAARRARSADSRTGPTSSTSPLAAQTIASEARMATFVANSVVCGAIRSVASSPTADGVRAAPAELVGGRLRVGDHEEQEDEDLRGGHEQPPELPALDRPDVPGRRHGVAARGEHADARGERQPEADRYLEQVQPPEDEEAADDDQHQCERRARATAGPTRARAGRRGSAPSRRKQRTRPKFDGLKTWLPRTRIRYFESSATADVPAKIHQPFMLHQSPCSVPGHAEDERDAVAGQQCARRPHDHVLASERDRELEDAAQ